MIITIDGPMASGKSSTAKALAQKLGLYHLNSGLLFRGLAYLLINRAGYTLATLHNLTPADLSTYLAPDRFDYGFHATGEPVLFFDGQDITGLLKTPEMDQASSIIGTHENVRAELYRIQRILADQYDFVADGRDCGSAVFPDAQHKFFLTASVEVRARRWLGEPGTKLFHLTFEQAVEQVRIRDERDSLRPIAPLRIPDGAVVIDNSALSREQTVALMLEEITKNKQQPTVRGE
jgi:cytidylate kinase